VATASKIAARQAIAMEAIAERLAAVEDKLDRALALLEPAPAKVAPEPPKKGK